ncbi:hypothetical protein HPB50_017084 [Hyalomma asiaticum]|uniref:Uncharacterized protein n=1 Tax=Hyalomma asiaticum TaxID=266040 RepID=A0ACB7THS5_HYAAI|nr:hypothetical protein HPB50_017084 [Hyalomma asiaticum]
MQKQKRNVLLFLDSCSSHMQLPQLKGTKAAYTSDIRFKVQPTLIKNCFRKAGFSVGNSDCADPLPLEDQPDPGFWSAVEASGSQEFCEFVTADDNRVSTEQLTGGGIGSSEESGKDWSELEEEAREASKPVILHDGISDGSSLYLSSSFRSRNSIAAGFSIPLRPVDLSVAPYASVLCV